MTKQKITDLMVKYHLDNSHDDWDPMIDNWCSVDVWRVITGELPEQGKQYESKEQAAIENIQVVRRFFDENMMDDLMQQEMSGDWPYRQGAGSFNLSAKRMLRRSLKYLQDQGVKLI